MTDDEKVSFFIKELQELTEKHGIYIDSCGDCYSIWIEQIEGNKTLDTMLRWDRKQNKYKYGRD